jgi:hypothetical protein
MWSLWGRRGGSGGRARLDRSLPPVEEVGKKKGSQGRRGGERGGGERRGFGAVTTAAGATVCATGCAGGNDHECRVSVSHGCG